MKINSNNSISFGKHKIPRYIYHLTSVENYNSMLKDGFMRTSQDPTKTMEKGIFSFELKNFLKFWKRNASWNNSLLQRDLIESILDKNTESIVLLKIPTKKLNKAILRIRSQNRLFSWLLNGKSKLAKEYNHVKNGALVTEQKVYNNNGEAIEYIYGENIPIEYVEKLSEKNLKGVMLGRRNCIKEIFAFLLKDKPEEKQLQFFM